MEADRFNTIFKRSNARRLSRRQLLIGSGASLTVGTLAALGVPVLRHTGASYIDGDFVGNLEVEGRSFYVESRGSGGPTVVFEAGALGRSDVWSRDLLEPEGERAMVLPAVAGFTHVFTYDRPGTIGEVNPDLDPTGPLFYPSRSDPAPQPRTIKDIVDDLHALLTVAKVPGPYVLVGHSLGGLSMRLFASTYPDDVAGMVLVDATHEDVWDEFEKALSPAAWNEFETLSVENPELMAAYPKAERLLTAPLVGNPNSVLMRRAKATSPLQPMPLAVLSHGIPFAKPRPEWPTDEMEEIMLALQDDLARLVPNARHVIAQQSGHNIHQDQPELVVEAIRQVVAAVRNPGSWAVSTPIASGADVAGLVDIDGRSLYLESSGAGSPIVILEAGAGNNSQIWDQIALPADTTEAAVFPSVAAFTRVCAYDRPNTYLDPENPSRSDRAPNPRSAADMVADLHALLTEADISAPYVLVGHSFGGLIVRLFASLYPDEVAGMVLVDAAHEDWWQTLDNLLTPAQGEALNAEPSGYPGLEQIDTDASADQMREASAMSPLRPVPLIVLTHGRPWEWPPGYPADAIEAAWRPLQEKLVSLVPDAKLVVAERSGHYIQLDEPKLVTDAIRQVVDAVRDPAAWTATPAATPA
ncbi:MAG: alpha/beta fold hydrolase [Thermomicrobiales bacterium]